MATDRNQMNSNITESRNNSGNQVSRRYISRDSAVDSMGNRWPTISGAKGKTTQRNEESEKKKQQETVSRQISERTGADPVNENRTRREKISREPSAEGSLERETGRRRRSSVGNQEEKKPAAVSAAKKRKASGRRIPSTVWIVPAAIVIALIGIGIYWGVYNRGTSTNGGDITEGVQYLVSLEQKDITVTQEKINEVKKQERREALENGDVSVWSLFYDYAVLGDSRSVGFDFYELLDANRVFADAGNTIAIVPERISQLQAVNPGNIFLCYGINDVSIGLYDTPEIYAEEMDKTVQLLQENFPNATIYVNSIFPAKDPAFETSEKWREIPDYNVAVKAMCEEKGYRYIDNTSVFEQYNELYDPDGIHFQKAFYDYWAINILTEMDVEES